MRAKLLDSKKFIHYFNGIFKSIWFIKKILISVQKFKEIPNSIVANWPKWSKEITRKKLNQILRFI
jgi:hypothetical protein